MPYISPQDRHELATREPATAGELNYLITRLVARYIERRGERYSVLNEAVGVLECAKLELYRRLAAPYEDGKIRENGDVYK